MATTKTAPPSAPTPFVVRLKQILKDRGWTPYDWSTRAGLSNSHVQNMMDRNASRPAETTVHKLAAAAGVSAPWLARGEGPMVPTASSGAVVDVDDPKMRHRDGYDGNLRAARKLRPQHGDYLWEVLGESDPLVVVPLTPALLADLADVLAKYVPAPAEPAPRKRT